MSGDASAQIEEVDELLSALDRHDDDDEDLGSATVAEAREYLLRLRVLLWEELQQ